MRNQLTLTLFTLIIAVLFCSIADAGLDSGLIGYWPLDERNGDTAGDKSRNNHDAKLIGSAAWAPNDGKIGGAVQLDGTGSSVEDDDGGEYINGLDAFTVSVWVKSTSIPTDLGIFHGIDPAGSDNVFTLRYDSAGWKVAAATSLIKAGISTTGGDMSYESASDVQTTEWQHLVLTWSSGNQFALYIDGVLDKPEFNEVAKDGEITAASKFVIGRGAKDNNGTSWDGLIDDVRLYNRVLEEEEIASLATGVLPVEPTGKLATTWANLKLKRDYGRF